MTPVTVQSKPQLLSCGDIRERQCLLKQELGRRVKSISLRKSGNKFVRKAASLNAGGDADFGAARVVSPNPDFRTTLHCLQDADSSSRQMYPARAAIIQQKTSSTNVRGDMMHDAQEENKIPVAA